MSVYFCCDRFSFFSTSEEIGWEEDLQNDLFGVKWDIASNIKPVTRSQSNILSNVVSLIISERVCHNFDGD